MLSKVEYSRKEGKFIVVNSISGKRFPAGEEEIILSHLFKKGVLMPKEDIEVMMGEIAEFLRKY